MPASSPGSSHPPPSACSPRPELCSGPGHLPPPTALLIGSEGLAGAAGARAREDLHVASEPSLQTPFSSPFSLCDDLENRSHQNKLLRLTFTCLLSCLCAQHAICPRRTVHTLGLGLPSRCGSSPPQASSRSLLQRVLPELSALWSISVLHTRAHTHTCATRLHTQHTASTRTHTHLRAHTRVHKLHAHMHAHVVFPLWHCDPT